MQIKESGARVRLPLLCLLSAIAIAGCSAQSQTRVRENNAVPVATNALAVRVFEVQSATNVPAGDLLIPASISVENSAVVLAEIDGRIVNLPVQEGSRVAKGEILAQFNDDAQRGQVRQAELDVSRLNVEAEQLQALIKLNGSEFDRESLLAKQGLVSAGEVEKARYKLDESIQEFKKNRLSAESALAHVEVAKLELEKTTVRAPVTGVITHRYIAPGTDVAKSEKLFEVAQLSNLELRFRVPQTYGQLDCGQVFDLSTDDQNGVIAKVRIRRREPIADAISNTFGYVGEIAGAVNLMPGLTVYVHLPRSGDARTGVWLPLAAFPAGSDLKHGVSSTLFVVNGEKVASRTVMIKAVDGDQVEIESGLMEKERVVLAPPPNLKDGDRVTVNY